MPVAVDEPTLSQDVGQAEVEDPPVFKVAEATVAENTNVIEWGINWFPADITLSSSMARVKLSDWLSQLVIRNESLSESGVCSVKVYVRYRFYDPSGTLPDAHIPVHGFEFTTATIAPDSTYSVDTTTIEGNAYAVPPDDIIEQVASAVLRDDGTCQRVPTLDGSIRIQLYYGATQTDDFIISGVYVPYMWVVNVTEYSIAETLRRQTYNINDVFTSLTGTIAILSHITYEEKLSLIHI